MKIYWKRLIWVYVFKHLWRLINYHKSCYWKTTHGCYDWIWNSKQWADCEREMASLLPKLDDVMRRATVKDNALTVAVMTQADKKIYKNGKVIVIKKSTCQQSNNQSTNSSPNDPE